MTKVRNSVGRANRPTFEWIGGKSGYLWVGDDEGDCLVTVSAAYARRLRDMLDDALAGV